MRIKLSENGFMPVRAHSTDAGLDLLSPVDVCVPAESSVCISTGVHVELPINTVGMVKSKSGLNVKHNITSEGVIDVGSAVSYDRVGSSFTTFKKEELPTGAYKRAEIFHTSGITLALGEEIRENVIEMMKLFKENGALISFDVNYRAALWDEKTAREVLLTVLPLIDILFISEETSRRTFEMSGSLHETHKHFASRYPNLEIIASTKRLAASPRKHTFSSLVYDCREDTHYEQEPYRDIDVVDRIGSGDAYVAGALFGLLEFRDLRSVAEYGDAMAALKNTVMGDMTECDLADIERIIKNHNASGPMSEMER